MVSVGHISGVGAHIRAIVQRCNSCAEHSSKACRVLPAASLQEGGTVSISSLQWSRNVLQSASKKV